MSTSVAKLKEHLEDLFPGQWLNTAARTRTLSTGLAFLDQGLTRGLARQKMSAWIGPASSGKTSLLRSIINHWLASGFQIAYIDKEDKLLASNWIFIENDEHKDQEQPPGKFWVIRDLPANDYLWATETLVRSNIFDVVIVDLGSGNSHYNSSSQPNKQMSWRSSKVYARWQNSLSKSKTALLLLTDNNLPAGWNFYTQLDFHWGENIQYSEGLCGKTMILPAINCCITKNGLAHNTEVPITAYVANRLFTHSPVPDRRSAKT